MKEREEFIKELRALCDKHGLYIVDWSGMHNLVPANALGENVLEDFEYILEEMKESEEYERAKNKKGE